MEPSALFSLHGTVAVVTGGSGILGGAMAQGLLDAGASVVVLGTSRAKTEQKAAALRGPEERKAGYACDVTDQEQLKVVRSQILSRFGRIDTLINAAGGNRPGATIQPQQNFFDLDISEFQQVTSLNFLGTVVPTFIFAEPMAAAGKGSVINISSVAAVRALTRVAGYSGAKAAVENFTRWLAVEMALKFGEGIRVNAIAPGFFLTEQNRTLLQRPDGSPTDRMNEILRMTPFKRLGTPSDLAGTAVWLAASASSFVTGIVVPVDGGFSAYSGV
ncbi:MAG: SDR family oxidoreductase [Bacteroidetes bacterium]|nr:SDR family oxidoreductase [Bacteroidota bacterium]